MVTLSARTALACAVGERSDPLLSGLFSLGPALVAFLVSAWLARRWQKNARARRLALAVVLVVPFICAFIVLSLATTFTPSCAFCSPDPDYKWRTEPPKSTN